MRGDASSNALSGRQTAVWLILSFLVWLFCFKGFVSGHLSLQSDAVGYYQHIRFFIDNMVKGVYPFWDPGINGGVPNEFFLRRMGAYNPFLLIPVLLRHCGLSHLSAYTAYLSVYYFMAALGFYYLCRVVLRHRTAAYGGFLIFLFSSLGTRQFDSYIVLVSVPLVWFFAFFLDFFRRPRGGCLLGATFCLMNLATTYIPLYFLVIFASFLLFFIVLFPRLSWQRLREAAGFLRNNKILTAICLLGLIMSMVPAVMIFQSAHHGEFVMPRRAATAESSHALAVGKQTVTEWAMLEELVYTSAFVDLRRFKFAIIYFPGFIYLLYLMGACVRLSRKFLLLVIWGGFLFLLSVPALSPLYDILHQHIFIFKYFRNLHWFFWLAMLPIVVLAAAVLLDDMPGPFEDATQRRWWLFWTAAVHTVFAVAVILLGNTIVSTYAMIAVSALFFAVRAFPGWPARSMLIMVMLTLAVGIQALEVYHYLNVNSAVRRGPYKGDDPYDTASYANREIMGIPADDNKPSLYYALKSYHDLYGAVKPSALFDYKAHKFILFDEVTVDSGDRPDYARLERMFRTKENKAFVETAVDFAGQRPAAATYTAVDGGSGRVQLVNATVNEVELRTELPHSRFLVFNQNWHPQWRATVDGDRQPLAKANGSFMGLSVPAGTHTVRFAFGAPGYRLLHYCLLALFYGIFIGLAAQAVWEGRKGAV